MKHYYIAVIEDQTPHSPAAQIVGALKALGVQRSIMDEPNVQQVTAALNWWLKKLYRNPHVTFRLSWRFSESFGYNILEFTEYNDGEPISDSAIAYGCEIKAAADVNFVNFGEDILKVDINEETIDKAIKEGGKI